MHDLRLVGLSDHVKQEAEHHAQEDCVVQRHEQGRQKGQDHRRGRHLARVPDHLGLLDAQAPVARDDEECGQGRHGHELGQGGGQQDHDDDAETSEDTRPARARARAHDEDGPRHRPAGRKAADEARGDVADALAEKVARHVGVSAVRVWIGLADACSLDQADDCDRKSRQQQRDQIIRRRQRQLRKIARNAAMSRTILTVCQSAPGPKVGRDRTANSSVARAIASTNANLRSAF